MGHRSPQIGLPQTPSRGNLRTRGGAGRHNMGRVGPMSLHAAVRMCLYCGQPFRSHGPWNRFCGRCRRGESHEGAVRTYRVSDAIPRSFFRQFDDFD